MQTSPPASKSNYWCHKELAEQFGIDLTRGLVRGFTLRVRPNEFPLLTVHYGVDGARNNAHSRRFALTEIEPNKPPVGQPAKGEGGHASLGFVNWLSALAIAATLSIVWDEPSQPTARTPEQIAMDYCGPGAAISWTADGGLTCRMHNGRGKPVVVAGVKP